MNRPGITVVIPAYEPSERLPRLITELADLGLTSVLVVDDGSGPRYRPVFDEAAALPGVRVLRHDVNRGKGAALRSALGAVRDDDVAGVVTADADGQHLPADIRRVADELLARTGTDARVCVLGERDFDLPDIPLRSRFGNRLTTGIVRAVFGRRLPDTQTGLRGLSSELIPELLQVPGDRFEYEMRALMYLLRTGARIEEVPITTVYEDGGNATSHFRPLMDSAIIYAAILRQLGAFVLSSGLGAAVDIAVFALVIDVFFGGHPTVQSVGVSTVVARAVSSVANYLVNHVLVFRSGARVHRTFARYTLLALGVLISSWWLTTGLAHLLGHHVVWAKILVDTALFFAGYVIQQRWVFPAEQASRHADEPTHRDVG